MKNNITLTSNVRPKNVLTTLEKWLEPYAQYEQEESRTSV